MWSSGWFYHPGSKGNIAVCSPALEALMQEYIPGATVHGQKRPGRSGMLLDFPCKGNMLHRCRFPGLESIPSEQTIGQCCSIYVHLQLSASFENHAAEESCQETSSAARECATADTCSSSVLWTRGMIYEPRRYKGRS